MKFDKYFAILIHSGNQITLIRKRNMLVNLEIKLSVNFIKKLGMEENMELSKLNVLSGNEIDSIHESSVKILEDTGVMVDSKRALQFLSEKGCIVDFERNIVRYPRSIIEKCIEKAPSKIALYDRDKKPAFVLGDGKNYCASGHNAVFCLIDNDGARRDSNIKDIEEFAMISDHLSEIDMIGVPAMPQDVTPQTTLLYAVKALLENSKKPIFYSAENEFINKAVIEMSKAILGTESLKEGCNLISQLSSTSPLFWEKGAVEALFTIAKEGVPLNLLPQPITGMTAPYTLAGILTLHNAEVLSGITTAQLINPGTPVIYGAAWTTYEMKLNNVLIGRPESSILRIAGSQMAHYYNIPSHTTSPETDSNLLDEQNAWEKMLSIIAGMSGKNDLIVNLGMFGTGMTISLEQLVLDNEMCRIVKRFLNGMQINTETIALDTIKSVGPRGTYIIEDHTFDYLRSGEHSELVVSNGQNYDNWLGNEHKSVVQKAAETVERIISNGNKCPLEQSERLKLSDIIEKYESQMKFTEYTHI